MALLSPCPSCTGCPRYRAPGPMKFSMAVLAPNLWHSQGHTGSLTTFLLKLPSGCRSEASVSPDPTQGQVQPTSTACPSVPAAQPGREQRGEGGLCGPSRSLCLPQAPSPGSSLAEPNPRLSGHSTQRRNSRCGPRERCAEGPKPPLVSPQLVLTATPLGPRVPRNTSSCPRTDRLSNSGCLQLHESLS